MCAACSLRRRGVRSRLAVGVVCRVLLQPNVAPASPQPAADTVDSAQPVARGSCVCSVVGRAAAGELRPLKRCSESGTRAAATPVCSPWAAGEQDDRHAARRASSDSSSTEVCDVVADLIATNALNEPAALSSAEAPTAGKSGGIRPVCGDDYLAL